MGKQSILYCLLSLLLISCVGEISSGEEFSEDSRDDNSFQNADTDFLSNARPGDILLSSHNEDGACQYLYDWLNALVNPQFCHAMLVTSVEGARVSVVEAAGPGLPVRVVPDIRSRVSSNAHVVLLRVPSVSDTQRREVVAKGLSYVGRPYAEPFEFGDGMYCSYLVYLAYLEGSQTDLSGWIKPVTPDDLEESSFTKTIHDAGFCNPCSNYGMSVGACDTFGERSLSCDENQCAVDVESCPDAPAPPDECFSCEDAGIAQGSCVEWSTDVFYECYPDGCIYDVLSCER